MKVDVEYLEFMWPMKSFLITCADARGKSNIIAVSFCMPVSKEPPLIACAIGRKAFSCELIADTKEFIVNVPTAGLKQQVYYCGYNSGRQVDKFKETDLTPKPARQLKAPIIDECIAHMECVLQDIFHVGDKDLFVGKVVEAYADESIVSGEKKANYSSGDFPRKIYGTRFLN
jgi:flavin reductase (DIM6/NTAB) family NADH-FMN oxidoreductase RutF